MTYNRERGELATPHFRHAPPRLSTATTILPMSPTINEWLFARARRSFAVTLTREARRPPPVLWRAASWIMEARWILGARASALSLRPRENSRPLLSPFVQRALVSNVESAIGTASFPSLAVYLWPRTAAAVFPLVCTLAARRGALRAGWHHPPLSFRAILPRQTRFKARARFRVYHRDRVRELVRESVSARILLGGGDSNGGMPPVSC